MADAVRNVQHVWGKGVSGAAFKTVEEYNEWTLAQLNAGTIPAQELSGESGALGGEYGELATEFKAKVRQFVRARLSFGLRVCWAESVAKPTRGVRRVGGTHLGLVGRK